MSKPELHYLPQDIWPTEHKQTKAKIQVQIGTPNLLIEQCKYKCCSTKKEKAYATTRNKVCNLDQFTKALLIQHIMLIEQQTDDSKLIVTFSNSQKVLILNN